MAKFQYLPIDLKAGFPQRFLCRVAGTLLVFVIHYNPEGDFYTATILDQHEEVIVYNKPFIYGEDLLGGVVDDRLPAALVVAADLSGKTEGAGKADFMSQTYPWIMVVS